MNAKHVANALKYFFNLIVKWRFKGAKEYVELYSIIPKLMGFYAKTTVEYKAALLYEYAKYLYYADNKDQAYLLQCVPRALYRYYLSHKTRHYELGSNAIDKWRFYQLMVENGLLIPETYALKKDDQFFDLKGKVVNVEEFPDGEIFFTKPFDSSGGLSTSIATKQQLRELANGFMVQEVLKNSGSIKEISGTTSPFNTIRVYTFISPKTLKMHLLSATLKIGALDSITDNLGKGGVGVPIDCSSGKLGEYGVSEYSKEKYYEIQLGSRKFANCSISEWSNILDYLHKASMIIGTQFVGWDIGITDKGVVAVEANSGGAHFFPQVYFEPFLFSPYIKAFVANEKDHKWIKMWRLKLRNKFPEIEERIYTKE
ncbi:MAG: sugar-transfer associated ATP-grasp domain-containing protein [Sphaerochaetaceae bacterium]|jgi:hypothetical protein